MGGNLDIFWLGRKEGGKRYSWKRGLLLGTEGVEDTLLLDFVKLKELND